MSGEAREGEWVASGRKKQSGAINIGVVYFEDHDAHGPSSHHPASPPALKDKEFPEYFWNTSTIVLFSSFSVRCTSGWSSMMCTRPEANGKRY
jgi:hypothetical protein